MRQSRLPARPHLASLGGAHGKTEQSRHLRVALHLELGKRGGVTLDRLGALALHGVQLHGTHYTVLLHNNNNNELVQSSFTLDRLEYNCMAPTTCYFNRLLLGDTSST